MSAATNPVPTPPLPSSPASPSAEQRTKRSRGEKLLAELSPVVNTPRRIHSQSFVPNVVANSATAVQQHYSPTETERRLSSQNSDKRHRTEVTTLKFWAEHLTQPLGDQIIIKFDGAHRNGKEPKCASAAYVHTYDCPLSKGQIVPASTNQQAEICGIHDALLSTLRLAALFPEKTYYVRGDARYVVDYCNSGQIHAPDDECLLPNAKFWNPVRVVYRHLIQQGVKFFVNWVPRRLNCESDELCNAALDSRPHNDVHSPTSLANLDLHSLLKDAMVFVTANKRACFRSLPRELSKAWTSTLMYVLADPLLTLTTRRQLFCIAPHLLSVHFRFCRTQDDFRVIRSHIAALRDADYLKQCLEDLVTVKPPSPSRDAVDERIRIATLAARGLFGRIIKDDDIFVVDPTTVKPEVIADLFPTSNLPPPLPISQTHYTKITYTDLCLALKLMGRGKAPGLSGWTRELFAPLLQTSNTQLHLALAEIFTSIVNVQQLKEEEKELLTSSWLCLLSYKKKPEKLRPICIRDFISKLIWSHLISRIKDPRLCPVGSAFKKKGGCQVIAQALQYLLDSDSFFLSMDMTNAFNLCSRHKAFEYLLSCGPTYHDMFPFLNLFYARVTVVRLFAFNGVLLTTICCTTGSAQGCSSGPFFFHVSFIHINHNHHQVLNVVDDVYIVEPSIATLDFIFELFTQSGLVINKAKHCHIVGSRVALTRVTQLCSHITDKYAIKTILTSQPFFTLGTGLIPDWPLALNQKSKYVNPFLDTLCSKTIHRLKKLPSLDTTLQVKFMTLRMLQFYLIYLVSSVSHFLLANLCTFLERNFITTLENILCVGTLPHTCYDLIFSQLEVGGLGFVPFGDVAKALRNNLDESLVPILNSLKIKHNIEPTQPRSLQWVWNHIASTRSLSSKKISSSDRSYCSWISVWPNLRIRQFEDTEYLFGILNCLQYLPSASTTCIFRKKIFDFRAASPKERFDHWYSCNRCGSAGFHHRHEAVLTEAASTAKHHLVVFQKYPKNMPVPGKSKGGPDFLITQTKKTLVGDVAVTSHSTMSSVFSRKMTTYRTFSPRINALTLPFILNTRGTLSYKTARILRDVGIHEAFIRDVSINTQCALIKSLASSYSRLNARPDDDPSMLTVDDTTDETFDEDNEDVDEDNEDADADAD